jgi:hypothetical protein
VQDNPNGDNRVTMAVLGTKMEHVISELATLGGDMRSFMRQQAACNDLHRDRIWKLEAEMRAMKWIGTFAGAVLLALVIAVVKNALGF